jgi:flagellar basal-body rod modification protein FlgD
MPDAVSATGSTASYSATPAVDRPDQMGKDVVLKLLVAQMRYQDPSNPVDSSQMMAQTATFSQVEKLEQLVTQNASMLVLQESATAGALVGRTATYTDSTGASRSGVVTSVKLASRSSEAIAVIGGAEVQVGRITAITAPAASTGTAPTSSTAS